MTPTTAAVIAVERAVEFRLPSNPLDVGRAGEDPKKARREGRPQRHECADETHCDRRAFPMRVSGEVADELSHEDERPGRRFGKAKPVHHLAGIEPA